MRNVESHIDRTITGGKCTPKVPVFNYIFPKLTHIRRSKRAGSNPPRAKALAAWLDRRTNTYPFLIELISTQYALRIPARVTIIIIIILVIAIARSKELFLRTHILPAKGDSSTFSDPPCCVRLANNLTRAKELKIFSKLAREERFLFDYKDGQ